ncbi:hypothetical protein MHYP_G00075090 [Metynnis hypsauchen]
MAGKTTKTPNLATPAPRVVPLVHPRTNVKIQHPLTGRQCLKLKPSVLSFLRRCAKISVQEVAHLKAQSKLLENKCEDLEARSRRNNIRIVGVLESQAGSTGAISILQRRQAWTELIAPWYRRRDKVNSFVLSWPAYTTLEIVLTSFTWPGKNSRSRRTG